jgi:hypothetical protein
MNGELSSKRAQIDALADQIAGARRVSMRRCMAS